MSENEGGGRDTEFTMIDESAGVLLVCFMCFSCQNTCMYGYPVSADLITKYYINIVVLGFIQLQVHAEEAKAKGAQKLALHLKGCVLYKRENGH